MFDSKRIRTPWKHRWQRFRYTVLPLASFAVCVTLTIWMWGRQVDVTNVVAEVERRRFDVASGVAGQLIEIAEPGWTLFQRVEREQLVAQLDPTPVKAALATAQQEIAQLVKAVDAAEAEFVLNRRDRQFDQQIDYAREQVNLIVQVERLDLDILDRKIQIATDDAELQRLDQQIYYLKGDAALNQRLVAPRTLDDVQKQRLIVEQRKKQSEVALRQAEQQRATAAARLAEFSPLESRPETATRSRILAPLQAAIETQKGRINELQIQIEALVIRAPVSGTIAAIYRWPGQQVQAGEPILTIAAEHGEYIIAYVRQDQPFRPTVGMEVVVRTRVPGQPSLSARVTEVGPQFEPAPIELQRDPTRPEWVLPVRISFPERLDARPGEPLDLFFKLGANNQRG